MKHSFFLFFSVIFLISGCNLKKHSENDNVVINRSLAFYLDSVQVDTFCDKWEIYPGVINLFARNVNDSNFILLLPGQCFFKTPDYYGFFIYKEKCFICQGDSFLLKSLIDLDNIKPDTTIKWKYCNDVSIIDYDPKHLALLIKSKDLTETIDISIEKASEIMTGEKPPYPLSINYNNDYIYEE